MHFIKETIYELGKGRWRSGRTGRSYKSAGHAMQAVTRRAKKLAAEREESVGVVVTWETTSELGCMVAQSLTDSGADSC